MKRLLIPLMIIISVLPLNAKSGFKTKGQEIYATIDTHYIMQIEEISYNGGNGIDLNIERSGNNQRNLIRGSRSGPSRWSPRLPTTSSRCSTTSW